MASADTLAENERLVQEMTPAIWGADGSPEAIDDYFASDVVAHEPGETIRGREGYKAMERGLREAMPDLDGEVEFTVCQDDLVAAYYRATGTHTGELWGIPPTGESGEVTGIAVYRIEDDRVVECWHEFDKFGMFQQLGLVPEFGEE